MKESKPTLKEVEEIIHKVYYLRQSTNSLVTRAECEDKLIKLFQMKENMEEEISLHKKREQRSVIISRRIARKQNRNYNHIAN